MNNVIAAVIEVLMAELHEVERRALVAAEGATHEESRPEDPKDTRGLETSYLAHGLAKRARALENDIDLLRFLSVGRFDSDSAVTTGAQITLEDEEGTSTTVVLLPCAGGTEIEVNGKPIRVVTLKSPLGNALIDKRVGDAIELLVSGTTREYTVLAIS